MSMKTKRQMFKAAKKNWFTVVSILTSKKSFYTIFEHTSPIESMLKIMFYYIQSSEIQENIVDI